jgi:hypothetical protein
VGECRRAACYLRRSGGHWPKVVGPGRREPAPPCRLSRRGRPGGGRVCCESTSAAVGAPRSFGLGDPPTTRQGVTVATCARRRVAGPRDAAAPGVARPRPSRPGGDRAAALGGPVGTAAHRGRPRAGADPRDGQGPPLDGNHHQPPSRRVPRAAEAPVDGAGSPGDLGAAPSPSPTSGRRLRTRTGTTVSRPVMPGLLAVSQAAPPTMDEHVQAIRGAARCPAHIRVGLDRMVRRTGGTRAGRVHPKAGPSTPSAREFVALLREHLADAEADH